MNVKRGDIIETDLEPVKGSEQGKRRPSLVIQNDTGNKHSPTTIVAPITSRYDKIYPTNVELSRERNPLEKDSVVLLNQIRTVSKQHRLKNKLGQINRRKLEQVDKAIKISLGL